MAKVTARMESYGMNPETLRAVLESNLRGQALAISPHLVPEVEIAVESCFQGGLGTFLTSATLTVDAPTASLDQLSFMVSQALSDTSDEHRHGDYESKPEAFRFDVEAAG